MFRGARSVSLGQVSGEGHSRGSDPRPAHAPHPELARRGPTVPEQPPREVLARNMATGKFKRKDLEARNHRQNANIIIDNVVYDITEFLDDHPGGVDVLLNNAGKDASECFHEVGHSEIALDWRKQFVIGEVVDEDKWEVKGREPPPVEPPEPLTLGSILSVWGPPVIMAAFATLIYIYLFS